MSLTITLVRHGNTDANNERWLQGHVDTDLNKNGQAQAKSCGERLKIDITIMSIVTASAIMSHHPDLSIAYEPMLRERDFGKLSRQPLKCLTSKSARQHLTVNEMISNHGGESEFVFRSRIVKAYETLIHDAREKQYRSILVVTHGGPLKYLSRYWLENEFKVADGLVVVPVAQGNTSVTVVTMNNDDGLKMITEFNSISHLKNQSSNQPPPAV